MRIFSFSHDGGEKMVLLRVHPVHPTRVQCSTAVVWRLILVLAYVIDRSVLRWWTTWRAGSVWFCSVWRVLSRWITTLIDISCLLLEVDECHCSPQIYPGKFGLGEEPNRADSCGWSPSADCKDFRRVSEKRKICARVLLLNIWKATFSIWRNGHTITIDFWSRLIVSSLPPTLRFHGRHRCVLDYFVSRSSTHCLGFSPLVDERPGLCQVNQPCACNVRAQKTYLTYQPRLVGTWLYSAIRCGLQKWIARERRRHNFNGIPDLCGIQEKIRTAAYTKAMPPPATIHNGQSPFPIFLFPIIR